MVQRLILTSPPSVGAQMVREHFDILRNASFYHTEQIGRGSGYYCCRSRRLYAHLSLFARREDTKDSKHKHLRFPTNYWDIDYRHVVDKA